MFELMNLNTTIVLSTVRLFENKFKIVMAVILYTQATILTDVKMWKKKQRMSLGVSAGEGWWHC